MKTLTLSAALICTVLTAGAEGYSDGIYIINEDWYGHNNSTLNVLRPDDAQGEYWSYRAIQHENPGIEIGCTAQSGQIWGNRLYIISKKASDPGSTVTGGRITVADASTLKVLHQQELIDPSGAQCDGRGFVGVDDNKAYVSSSNGIWVFSLDTYTVTGRIDGTANPYVEGDEASANSNRTLYRGQCGTMVNTGGRIFAAHQEYGLLVIDPTTDRVTDTISLDVVKEGAGIGSITVAKDGSVWCSVAAETGGISTALPYLLRVDAATLATEVVDLDSNFAPSNSWHSWTPDTFCASSRNNVLYWSGGVNSWFSGSDVYSMDVDTREVKHLIDFASEGENWKVYGCSMRVNPVSDELYMSLYHDTNVPTYIVRRCNADGSKIRDYDMISGYWFPSIPIFPSHNGSGIGNVNTDGSLPVSTEYVTIDGLRFTTPPAKGIYIIVETMADGTRRSTKAVRDNR